MSNLYRCLSLYLFVVFTVAAPAFGADESRLNLPQAYIAPVRIHTAEELSSLLLEAEQLPQYSALIENPVMFVLHGEEARSFIRGNYEANQSLVDRSAKLTALGVVQIEICERWMGTNGVKASQLQPFVKTVRYAPARISALKDDGYIYF